MCDTDCFIWMIRHLCHVTASYLGVTCSSDSDCASYLGVCDMDDHVCSLPPLSDVEASYLECYLSKMSSSTEYYIRYLVLSDPLIEYPRNSSEFISAVRSAADVADCVSQSSPLDITKRSRYVWEGTLQCQIDLLGLGNLSANESFSIVNEMCPPQYCLGSDDFYFGFLFSSNDVTDTSCLMPGDQCYTACYASFVLQNAEESSCAELTCPFENVPCDDVAVCAYCSDGIMKSFFPIIPLILIPF